MQHPGIDMVSLTGSVATGKRVIQNSADTVKRLHLELGGKAPVIVFDDADPSVAAQAIVASGYWNSASGSCGCMSCLGGIQNLTFGFLTNWYRRWPRSKWAIPRMVTT